MIKTAPYDGDVDIIGINFPLTPNNFQMFYIPLTEHDLPSTGR